MAVKVSSKKKEESPIIQEMQELDDAPPELLEDKSFQILKGREMPPFPSKTIKKEDSDKFFRWVDSLEPEDFTKLNFYVYRLYPVIDREQVNPNAPSYIDKMPSKFTKNDIIRLHGSGEYKFMVNDLTTGITGKSNTTIGIAYVSINDSDHPPIVPLDELVVSHPNNRSFVDKLVAEGKMTREGKMINAGGTNNDALIGLLREVINQRNQQPPKDTTADNIGQMYVKASDSMMNMLKEQLKSDDPEKLIKMLSMFKEMLPKPEQGNSALEMITKMQSDMMKIQAESQNARESMMMKMMELVTSKKDDSDTFDKELDRMMKFKELIGDNGHSAKKSTLETILEYSAPVVGKIADIGLNILSMQNFKAGLAKQGMPMGGVQPQPPASPSTAPQQPAGAIEQPKVVEMPNQEIQLMLPMLQTILPAIQRGQTGDDYAAGLEGMYGPLAYDNISSLGKEKIIEVMRAIPQFQQGMEAIGATDEIVGKFVDEFIEWGKEDEPK